MKKRIIIILALITLIGCMASASNTNTDPGSTDTDLSNYYTKTEADTKFATKQDLEIGSVSNDPDVVYGPGYMNYCAYKTNTHTDYQVRLDVSERDIIKILLTDGGAGATIYILPIQVFANEVNKNGSIFNSSLGIMTMQMTSTGGNISCFNLGCDTTAFATATRNLVNEILDNATYDGRFSAYIQPNVALFDLKDNRFKNRCTE